MSSLFARADDRLSERSAAEGLIAATTTASSSAASNSAAAKKLANRFTYSYPVYAVYLIVSFIFLATVINVTSVAYTRYLIRRRRTLRGVSDSPRSHSDKEAEAGARLPLRTGRASIRRLPHAVLNFFRIAAFRVTVPFGFGVYFTTAEVVIPAGYFIALMTFEFINCYSIATGRRYDPKFYANRAGILVLSQMPFVVALAGKNNIVTLLTGVSYEKLNILHRASSRTILILAWVHTIGRLRIGLKGDNTLAYGWMREGVVALTAFTLVVILGIRRLRNLAYELFLVMHIVLIFIYIICLFYHVRDFRNMKDYVWPCFLVWGLDRTLRLSRAIYLKYWQSRATEHTALVEILSSDSIRLTVTFPSTSAVGWTPAQNAYVTIPAVSPLFPLEAHPFTIATIDTPVTIPSPSTANRAKEEKVMKFIIRSRKGFTRRLYEYASQKGVNGVCRVSAWVDGPYGPAPHVHGYPTVVFIAGGSGVTFTLPLLLDIVRLASASSTLCRKVVFMWAIRKQIHIEWIADELRSVIRSAPSNLDIDIRIFVTDRLPTEVPVLEKDLSTMGLESSEASPTESPNDSKEKFTSAFDIFDASSPVTLYEGRPNLRSILSEDITTWEGPASVNVSGPESLINAVRDTLGEMKVAGPMHVLKGGASVALHVESFSI